MRGHLIRSLKTQLIYQRHDAVHIGSLRIVMGTGPKTLAVHLDRVSVVVVRTLPKFLDLRTGNPTRNNELDVSDVVAHGTKTVNVVVEVAWSSGCHEAAEAEGHEFGDDIIPVFTLGEFVKGSVEDAPEWFGRLDEIVAVVSINDDFVLGNEIRTL